MTTTYTDRTELSNFQKVLLTTNGSITELLEIYLSEPIRLLKLHEHLTLINKEIELAKNLIHKNNKVIKREIILQGKISSNNFMYANSYIFVDNLEQKFAYKLLNTNIPIGKLWSEQKVETYKEIIDYGEEPANKLSNYFFIDSNDNLVFRTYSVFSRKKLTMIITEKFPKSYFCAKL